MQLPSASPGGWRYSTGGILRTPAGSEVNKGQGLYIPDTPAVLTDRHVGHSQQADRFIDIDSRLGSET